MNYAQLLFPDFSLILCGYLVCRYTALNRTVWEQVESLVYFFLFPVLLFHSIVRTPLDLHAASHLIMAGLDERVFERFYRHREASGHQVSEATGTGLGLSLCREIVVAHGGRIRLVTDDEWVTFECALPLS